MDEDIKQKIKDMSFSDYCERFLDVKLHPYQIYFMENYDPKKPIRIIMSRQSGTKLAQQMWLEYQEFLKKAIEEAGVDKK